RLPYVMRPEDEYGLCSWQDSRVTESLRSVRAGCISSFAWFALGIMYFPFFVTLYLLSSKANDMPVCEWIDSYARSGYHPRALLGIQIPFYPDESTRLAQSRLL